MPVHALVASIWTGPEPAVLAVLDCLDEVFAHFVGRRLRVAMLAHNDLLQLLFIPLLHAVLLLLGALLLLLLIFGIRIQRSFFRFTFHSKVVREFALLALLTGTFLEELTQHRLGIYSERHLLCLHRLEQFRGLFARLFRGRLS